MSPCRHLVLILACLLTLKASATVHYVSLTSTNPAAPYTSWSTAATNIENAISYAYSGDTVLVTNGIYQTGAYNFNGTNRVFILGNITVQSVNGPSVTTIQGYQVPGTLNGANAVRCVYMDENCTLSGFTLAGGATLSQQYNTGGGIYCAGNSALVTNCVITGNASAYEGGGAYAGTFVNCLFSNNVAGFEGGGAYKCALVNCTVTANSATTTAYGGGAAFCTLTNCLITGNSASIAGGGTYGSTLVNCTVISNSASSLAGAASGSTLYNCIVLSNSPDNGTAYSTFNNCCTTPLPSSGVNFTNEPGFLNQAGGNFRLQIGSACMNAGSNAYNATVTDLDGNPRIAGGTIDLGAYENQFTGNVHYVSLNSTNPVSPYATWSTAATNLQTAANAASAGDYVVADSGIYTSTGTVMYGSESNAVVLTNGITLLSLNGPKNTLIVGGVQMRGVYVGSNSCLTGFTVTNGQSRLSGDLIHEQSGGGIWCEPGGAVSNCIVVSNYAGNSGSSYVTRLGGGIYGGFISNCIITGNFSGSGGGAASNVLSGCVLSNNTATLGAGAYAAALYNCTVSSNTAIYDGTAGSGGGCYQCFASNCSLTLNQANSWGGGAYQGTNFYCVISGNNAGNGGGTYQSTNYNSLLLQNSVFIYGGGAYGGLLYNCVISKNIATNSQSTGGGVYQGTLINCTVVGNSATFGGGGLTGGAAYNSIIYFNTANSGSNYYGTATMFNCCAAPYYGGYNNIYSDPLLLDWTNGFCELKCSSPCIAAGHTNSYIYGATNDIRGLPRPVDGNGGQGIIDIGAYQYVATVDEAPLIRTLSPFSYIATSYPLQFGAEAGGCQDYYWWDFGDGTLVTNQLLVTHAWSSAGTFNVKLSAHYASLGTSLASTFPIQVLTQPIYYVKQSGSSPAAPYTNWNTAANTIQLAIAAGTLPGRLVLVSNGMYRSTGYIVYGQEYNNLAMTNTVVVQSVNGPAVTIIYPYGGRCAYVGSNSILSGFTLTNGYTLSGGDLLKEQSGGNVWCEPGGTVTNCILTSGQANNDGGGAYQGIFYNCTFTNNRATSGGGTYQATLYNCAVISNYAAFSSSASGGGGFGGAFYNCSISSNAATSGYGGGVCSALLSNCVLAGNSVNGCGGGGCSNIFVNCALSNNSALYGGGAYYGYLSNCLVTGNAATNGGGIYGGTNYNCALVNNSAGTGGGAYAGRFFNCAIAGNVAPAGGGIYGNFTAYNSIIYDNALSPGGSISNWQGTLATGFNNCIYPQFMPAAQGNITNDPAFLNLAGGDVHLSANSPCINSGANQYVTNSTDLDGNPRIVAGTVDIGAYEYQTPSSLLSYAWAQTYGLATDGSADFTDADGDGLNNWQEWKAGTNPTNAASTLQMTTVSNSVSGTTVTWQSVSGITYYLQRSTNLGMVPAFSSLQRNLAGQAGTTSYTDTAATNAGPYFYRVGVQLN